MKDYERKTKNLKETTNTKEHEEWTRNISLEEVQNQLHKLAKNENLTVKMVTSNGKISYDTKIEKESTTSNILNIMGGFIGGAILSSTMLSMYKKHFKSKGNP